MNEMKKSSLLHALAVYPQERTPVSIEKEVAWDPKPVWIIWKTEKCLTPKSVSSQDVRSRRRILVGQNLHARNYLDYSILGKV
jgi:hypothetical protein